jgi:hypothetical protein
VRRTSSAAVSSRSWVPLNCTARSPGERQRSARRTVSREVQLFAVVESSGGGVVWKG